MAPVKRYLYRAVDEHGQVVDVLVGYRKSVEVEVEPDGHGLSAD